MGKKGKGKYFEVEEEMPKKKNIITEEQLMDKTHMDKTEFIPLLPEESLYEPYIYNDINEAAVVKITLDLNYLLYVNFKEFWATVLYNPTLKRCLSSCLTNLNRRWMNRYEYSKQTKQEFEADEKHRQKYRQIFLQPVCEHTFGLAQVILHIYHRIVSFNSENKQLASLYKLSEQISRKYILDVPRLFQLCQIYGETNPDLIKYIVKMYVVTVPDFYKILTVQSLPIVCKKVDDTIRFVKNLTDRQEYGINYSYVRLAGQKLSQGEQQLKKKVLCLMEFLSFINIINTITQYFPNDCVDHCFFNWQIHLYLQNIFFQLEAAYKSWNYQTQQIKMLGMINGILKQCIDYFVKYFERCIGIFVHHNKKTNLQAYLNSLERIFKDFGKRMNMSRKNQTRNMLLYKIIQKEVDIHSMLHSIYKNQVNQEGLAYGFNIEYLKEIIIAFDNQFKEQYINEEEPRQEEIEQETQAENDNDIDDIDEVQAEQKEVVQKLKPQVKQKQQKEDLQALEVLIPKRMRSEDYYQKLYADYNKKFYKGEYEDDYDQIADYDKRPMFVDQESSSESQEELQKHLITNTQNLERIKSMHNRYNIDRSEVRNKNANQPKYSRVENTKTPTNSTPNAGPKKYVAKNEPQEKKKYVSKQEANTGATVQKDYQEDRFQNLQRTQYREREQDAPEQRGGQGFKKSNKSYNYKPKQQQQNNEKGRNTNKNKEYEQKRYK